MNILNQFIDEKYAAYNGDSVELIQGIPDNSIHYTIFSPPFAAFKLEVFLSELADKYALLLK